MSDAMEAVELTGKMYNVESRPGGGVAVAFRVDCAEGSSRRWAWWPCAESPRWWQLLVAPAVLSTCGPQSLAGRRVIVTGTVRQDGTDSIDVSRIIDRDPNRQEARA